jgi:tetratricopeptide (TPR) repeat protein
MATVSAEPAPHDFRAIKIGIVGNSNSVMNNGYVKTLEQTPGLAITNRSIGSSPNVVLLDFLGRETVLDYDFIIIETAVVDFIQAGALYPRERSQETLELFIGQIRSASRAQVIILTIPTRYALLAPDAYWQEQLYRDTAARLGVPILDGFRLIRQLIGQAKITAAGTYLTRAEQLAAAFGLPGNVAPSLAWRDLRDRFVQTNALGVSAFVDHAHFSGTIHALVGSILADFIVSAMPDPHAASVRAAAPEKPPVIAIDTQDGSRVVRTSTLMSRDLGVLRAGDTASYQCPPGYRAYGLLLNQSRTFCFLKLTSPVGGVAFDMRFRPLPFDWIAVVVPIIDRIGDGVIEVTAMDAPPDDVPCRLLHNTDTRTAAWGAELGEMILVREDWRAHLALPVAENATAFHLEDTAWAKWAIEEAALRALPVVQGIETDGWFVPRDCSAAVANLLTKGTAALSLADQARLLLVLGMADRLPAFFQAATSSPDGDEELRKMYDAVRASQLGEIGAGVVPSAPNVTRAALAPATQRVPDIQPVPNTQPINVIDEEAPVSLPSTTHGNATATNPDLRSARPAIDAPLEAWIRTAEQAEAGDRIALLGEALERFPEEIRLLHDLARAHEKQRNWAAAETCWRRYIERERRHWWAYSALAAALRAQDRGADGDIVLREGVMQFPGEPQILAEVARAAQIRGDLLEATRTWDLVIARFPDQWIGYRGKAHALAHGGQHAEADQLTETYALTLPANIDALHDLARLAERRRDWKRAETVWRSFVAREQRAVWAYLALARVLREQALYPEARAVLRDALPRFPNDADLSAEAARCAELLGDLAEAAQFWQAIATLRPKSPDGPLGEADMLRRHGQAEAADTVIVAAIKRLPDEPLLLEAHGLNAIVRNAWGEALTRLEAAQRRFPSNDALRQRIYEVRLKIADEGGSTPLAEPEDEGAAEDRALVMQFESLGGGGHGCEFGIFQRHFGAEPLGLLRWADIFQDHLSTALETEFVGVGDPEFTNIFVPERSTEYWTTDTRYHMAMRSFVSVADVPLDRMRQQVTKRFRYLSRKLADDLRSGTKIFVYKNMKRNLTDAELRRLHAACRSYGDNTLLYIRYEDAGHPGGTVAAAGDGLLIGYIDHFSHTPDTDEYVGAATDALLQICRRAHAIWQQPAADANDQDCPPLAERLATAEAAARNGSVEAVRSLLPGLIAELGDGLQPLLPIAAALVSRAEFDAADAILRTVTAAMPAHFPAFEAYGMSAFHRRDWTAAISRWREVQAAFPDRPRAAVWLAGALQLTRQFDDAEDILRAACERFPDDVEVARDYARLPLARDNVEEVVARLAVLRERFPGRVDGFTMGAEALGRLGRFEEAENLLEPVRDQFGDSFHFKMQSAKTATSLGRWGQAFRRWDLLLRQSPDDQGVAMALGDAIMLWHLAKAEGDAAALAAELPDEIARRAGALAPEAPSPEASSNVAPLNAAPLPSDRDLFMEFEGLGDRCEFGLVQRHFGAEPIGLLRWSGIEPRQFIELLECRFAGVGEPENTFVRLNESSNEYFAGDNRFFYMHTFIKKNEGNESDLFEKFRKRLAYLKRKLIADLEDGEKIFVYKVHVGELTDAEAAAISAAIARHFPVSRVVLMRVARDPSQIGTVEPFSGNAVWAYLSRFSENLESRFIRFDEWRTALEAAKKYFTALPEPAPPRREDRRAHIDLLTRQGQDAEARRHVADLINQGADNTDLLHRAVRLALAEGGCDWIRDVWPRLVATIPDRQRSAHEAYLLFRQYCHDHDCQFLLTWMMSDPWPDRISEFPPLVPIVAQSRSTDHREVVDSLVVQNLHLIGDPMMLRVVRCLSHMFSDSNDYATLVADLLDRATEHDMPKELLITLAGSGRPHQALTDAIGEQLRTLIEAPSPLPHTADARLYLLVVLGDVLFPSSTAAVLGRLAQERDRSDDAATLAGVLSTMAHAHPPVSASAGLHSRQRLKICLCLSGQLRGYKAAFRSWEGLGLWNHDVAVVAHVWRDIGLRPPDNRHNAARAFSGKFLTSYQDVLDSRGWGYLADSYPKLLRRLTATNHVDEPELRALYAADAVVVEDEAQPEFAGRGNFWKMHYKVKSAHQLGRGVCPDADLYIRARPDQDMSSFASIDWHDLYRRANSESVIFSDSKRFFAPPWIWMDDRLAIGSGTSMDIYAAAFDHVAAAAAGCLYGYPNVYLPHAGFASTTQYFNIAVESLPSRQSFKLLNPPPMEPEEVATLIRADMQARRESATDATLLSAIETDLGVLAGAEMADRLQF